MAKKLTYNEMVAYAESILDPYTSGLSEEQIGERLFLLCLNCPDPVGAMNWIVAEAMPPVSAKGLVDKVNSLPPKDPRSLPESELSPDHPFRHQRVEE